MLILVTGLQVTLSSIDDEPRFTEMLNDWIKGGEVLAFPGFTHEPARKKKSRKRRYEQEAAEAKELQANGGLRYYRISL